MAPQLELKSAENLFASPLFQYCLNEFDDFNEMLIRDIRHYRSASAGLNKSNRAGWHSETDIWRRDIPSFEKVKEFAIGALKHATMQVSPSFALEKHDIEGSAWININGINAYNTPHEHPNYHWSGVYYVRVPETSSSTSGILSFLNPRSGATSWSIEGARFSDSNKAVQPYPGLLIIFPSYLRHWVSPNEEDDDRISVAFNARFRKR